MEMKKYVVSKKTFEILGHRADDTIKDDDKHFTILATDLNDAKTKRDEMEASSFNMESISIVDLLSIINNMERGHGSCDINPQYLKSLIKTI